MARRLAGEFFSDGVRLKDRRRISAFHFAKLSARVKGQAFLESACRLIDLTNDDGDDRGATSSGLRISEGAEASAPARLQPLHGVQESAQLLFHSSRNPQVASCTHRDLPTRI
ncbi:hypothetical protein HN011_012278 [Eciton burchellii]|nr:hypothetical protein HN011_012278 [Eciton burchellii]